MLEESGIRVAGVVHHGLDMKNHRVNIPFFKTLKRRLKDKSIILTVAANDPRKGLDKLLSAYRLVEHETQNSFLILHSKPTGYYNLTKTAESFKIKRLWLTNLYGKLTPTKLNALYNICNIYVQPNYSEGFGLPILEAFKFNKPTIAVDAPPFNEIIRHNKNGILVPSRGFAWRNYKDMILFKMHRYEAEDMASAIADLLSNQRLITKMQTEIHKEKCHWDIHRLYPKLLSYFA
jgi:glycosyltransferase involved in cell wall biosynthesis